MATGDWRAGTPPDDQRCPTGLTLAGGCVVVVGVTALAAVLVGAPGVRLGLVTVAVLVFTAVTGDGWAAIGVSAIAWAVGNGFLVNRLGELRWHGRLDAWFVIGLLSAVSVGMVTAHTRQGIRARRRWRPFDTLLNQPVGPAGPVPPGPGAAPGPAGNRLEPAEDKEI
jgi:hypothetical protein